MLLIVGWFTPSGGFDVLTSAGSCKVSMWPSATVALGELLTQSLTQTSLSFEVLEVERKYP